MSIDIQTVVEFHIKPALLVDAAQGGSLQTELAGLIEAQLALHGYTLVDMTDQEKVYAAALCLEALVPRLTQIFTDEIQERRAGPENVKLPDRARFFAELRKAIATMKATAEQGMGVTPVPMEEAARAWPAVGLAKWE